MSDRRWSTLETEIRVVDPKTLKRREVNARYMNPAQFKRLVDNFKTDGRMTGVVTVCLEPDGSLEILSGHHRTDAAIEAGFEQVEVLCITSPLDEERKTAIQLSHNSISGQDNPSILAQMWEGLGLDAKKFSGLTEDDIGDFKNIKIEGIGAVAARYEEMVLLFLPEDREIVEAAFKALGKSSKPPRVHVAALESFDAFFEAVVKTKERCNVNNSALAIATMAELALERLAQIEIEQAVEAETANAKAPEPKAPKSKPKKK
jgi:hypothetical protein